MPGARATGPDFGWCASHFVLGMPIADAAFGGVPGSGIGTNARPPS